MHGALLTDLYRLTMFDDGGLAGVAIFASGNLDEYRLSELLRAHAPIDGFGVGTRMNTSADAPYLDCAYKLTEYAGEPRRKRSEGKATWPGRKQVYRRLNARGGFVGDVLTVQGDQASGAPLLEPVVIGGRRTSVPPGLEASREHARRQLAAMPDRLRCLDPTEPYPVEVSQALQALARSVDQRSYAAGPASSSVVGDPPNA